MGPGGVHFGEPLVRAAPTPGKGVVAAGIQNDDVQFVAGVFHAPEHQPGVHALVFCVLFGLQPGVHGTR